MYNKQKEILREQIYDVIRCCCNMKKSNFSPNILINYGADELCGEAADDLTFVHIPDTLGIPQSYNFPFPNNVYFRDSPNPITLMIALFKRKKETRPPLTAKEYTDMILVLYKEYQEAQLQEQKRIDTIIQAIPKETADQLQKKLFLLFMQTLSIKEEEFSPDIIINEGIYKLSGKKAERFIHQSALCFNLPTNKVYNYFYAKQYFHLPMSKIALIIIILSSPAWLLCGIFYFLIFAILMIFYCIGLGINFVLTYVDYIIHGKQTEDSEDINYSKNKKQSKTITANEYAHEMLGLWAENQSKSE